MKKKFAVFFSLLTLLFSGALFVSKEPGIKAEAVSDTRLYITLNDSILARAPAFKLYTGSADVDLIKLPEGDKYTYYTDAAITNWMTLKNNGGQSINLYNISNVGFKSEWDQIVFDPAKIENWSAPAVYTTSVFVPPGEQYTVTLYNGENVIDTQTAYEGIAFTPKNVTVTGHIFEGWYTDPLFTSPYTPTVLTANTSLFGKYSPIDLNRSIRIYIASDNSWWYNHNARIDLVYWKTGVTPEVITMRKEEGNLHSAVIPNASFTHIKLERKDPADPSIVHNATGEISINLLAHDVIKFSGPLDNGYTGPLTVTDFSDTAPDISYLKTEVPLLSCSNYTEANALLEAYNRLGDNERELIDALTTPSHDDVPLTYKAKIDYYVSYASSKSPVAQGAGTVVKPHNSVVLFTVLGLATLAISAFYLAKKKKSNS